MAKSMTERIKGWRQKKSLEGGKSLTVMLDPESVKILEALKQRYQQSHAKLIARALSELHKTFACKPTESKAPTLSTAVNIHQSLLDIKNKLDRGDTIDVLKDEMKTAMKTMRSQGFSSPQIADQLYEAKIKTSKGRERWEAGMIRKWWK